MAGILIQQSWSIPFSIRTQLIFALVLSACLLLLSLFFKIKSYRYQYLNALPLILGLIINGFSLSLVSNGRLSTSILTVAPQAVLARVYEIPQQKSSSVKLNLQLIAFYKNNKWEKCKGKMIAFVLDTSFKSKYGDHIILKSKIQNLQEPANPRQFSFKQYLNQQGISYQSFVKTGEYFVLNQNSANPIFKSAYYLREKLLAQLKHYLPASQVGIAEGLLIGYTNDIDDETYNTYKNTGVLHVLSVSGLHVGILVTAFGWLLSLFIKNRSPRNALLLAILWIYAFVTGLGPAVLRATFMFSLVLIGFALKRRVHILNTLAASAFILLCYRPNFLFDTGFQLSYLALLGIVSFEPVFSATLALENYYLDKAWKLIPVSFAAQLATFPLSVYYFHQFPNYFLLANLWAIPFSFLAMYSALAAALLAWLPIIGGFVASVCAGFIQLLSWGIATVLRIPGSLSNYLYLNKLETWLIYGLIVCLLFLLYSKNSKSFIAILLFAIALEASFLLDKINLHRQHIAWAYSIKKGSALSFSHGSHTIVLGTSNARPDSKLWNMNIYNQMSYLSKGNFTYLPYTEDFHSSYFIKKGSLVFFGKKKFLLLNYQSDTLQNFTGTVDALIVSCSHNRIPSLLNALKPKLVLVNNNLNFAQARKWRFYCQQFAIPFYYLGESPALIL